MKALDLLNELRSQITSKPDKGQEKVFYEKYANTKPDYFKEASAMLENYGHLAAPVIHEMTDCERDRLGKKKLVQEPFT